MEFDYFLQEYAIDLLGVGVGKLMLSGCESKPGVGLLWVWPRASRVRERGSNATCS